MYNGLLSRSENESRILKHNYIMWTVFQFPQNRVQVTETQLRVNPKQNEFRLQLLKHNLSQTGFQIYNICRLVPNMSEQDILLDVSVIFRHVHQDMYRYINLHYQTKQNQQEHVTQDDHQSHRFKSSHLVEIVRL